MTTSDVYSGWLYQGKPFTDDMINKAAGFVYLITDLTNDKKYIGRKYFVFSRKKKGKRIKFDSDWKEYFGSSETLHKLIEEKGKHNFKREIICLGKTKGEVNFLEIYSLFFVKSMESDLWINESINKWRKKNILNYLDSLQTVRQELEKYI